MALISRKKIPYPISPLLREYLTKNQREVPLRIHFKDLLRFSNAISLYDPKGNDTLWISVFYEPSDTDEIFYALKTIYAHLKADGDLSILSHLSVDRVDLCTYGNTRPFRIRIVNQINDNFDYFYVKNADASRVYGLELEDIFSPNQVSYLTSGESLVEEHIVGIPGDVFMKSHLSDPNLNPIRLCKEFVKFNERCFVRLLGDMHSSNFIVDITPDFEEIYYRLRAIDFDQQSYEGKKSVYMPQYFRQNNAIIELGMKYMTPESVRQYQIEERSQIATRMRIEKSRANDILDVMSEDRISSPDYVAQLRRELARHYRHQGFMECRTMGQLVRRSLQLLSAH
ncbi:hypothetical protein GCM10027275_36600 [Rhabdobacter roseus]|uniref:Uncharacterized protein n=1 Tax=Rhabdobacter roseus TaxID=1655419 RepID=A0A840TXD4_9BACT|nr:hypothetical protein [Rhabdobacter roseus]MBB5285933.1 hypothetical protein [Rhabdobacter roseus]